VTPAFWNRLRNWRAGVIPVTPHGSNATIPGGRSMQADDPALVDIFSQDLDYTAEFVCWVA
jgi:hypothetical protein